MGESLLKGVKVKRKTSKDDCSSHILTKEQIVEVYKRLSNSIKDPKIELDYVTPYTLLVAVILSAQATDKGVNKATKSLFAKYNTPESMLELGEDGLKQYIKSIGLYNTKAKNIIKMSQKLVDDYNSKIPDNFDDLCQLPGVGRKSANVILNCLYGKDTIAVDTHVFRVSNRIGLAHAKNVLQTELQLMKNIEPQYRKSMHHLLVLHGRYICKAVKPLCSECCVNDVCLYYKNVKKLP